MLTGIPVIRYQSLSRQKPASGWLPEPSHDSTNTMAWIGRSARFQVRFFCSFACDLQGPNQLKLLGRHGALISYEETYVVLYFIC